MLWRKFEKEVESQLLINQNFSPEEIINIIIKVFAQIIVDYTIKILIHYIEINGEIPEDWGESYWEEE